MKKRDEIKAISDVEFLWRKEPGQSGARLYICEEDALDDKMGTKQDESNRFFALGSYHETVVGNDGHNNWHWHVVTKTKYLGIGKARTLKEARRAVEKCALECLSNGSMPLKVF